MLHLSDLPLDVFTEIAQTCLVEFLGLLPNNTQTSKHNLSKPEMDELRKLLKSIFTQLCYSIINAEDIAKAFDKDKANIILDYYNKNKYFLATTLLKEHNSEIKNVLDNFDWNVKWIVGSSVSTTLRYPLLQLDLALTKCSDQKMNHSNINLELTKDELDKLIVELESINKHV